MPLLRSRISARPGAVESKWLFSNGSSCYKRGVSTSKLRPNLFDHATSELSQDAIISWLLEWGSPQFSEADAQLHQCSHNLLAHFFALHDMAMPDAIEKVEIFRQSNNIDVLCIVNDTYPIIIEDKTGSQEHSGQLAKYYQDVTGRNFRREHILPIYFKTHEQSCYAAVREHGYKVFSRGDLLKILRRCTSSSDIFTDFRTKMEALEADFLSYRTLPPAEWYWHSWIGFYKELQTELKQEGECWGYVSNPSGGFLRFTWGWQHDDQYQCGVYLQLEETKFCFKIGDVEQQVRHSARAKWNQLFETQMPQHDFHVDRPARFGNGTYMTVAVLRGDYRLVGPNGLLDLPNTLNRINHIDAAFRAIVAQSLQEHASTPSQGPAAEAVQASLTV